MSCVLGFNPKRQDISLRRGITFPLQLRLLRRNTNNALQAVDVSAYTLMLTLFDVFGETVYEANPDSVSDDGRIVFTIPADTFDSDNYDGLTRGSYRVTAVQADGEALSVVWAGETDMSESMLESVADIDSGTVELLLEGDWRLDL